MKEDDLANQITPCCHIKQLNERITESERELGTGVDSFFTSGDITLDMVLPLLMRRKICSTLTICTQSLPFCIIRCLESMMKDKLFIDNKWVFTIQHLNIVLDSYYDDAGTFPQIRKYLGKYKDRVSVSCSHITMEVYSFSGQQYDKNPLVLSGWLPDKVYEPKELYIYHLFTKKETAEPIINRLLSIARVGMIKDFWKTDEE